MNRCAALALTLSLSFPSAWAADTPAWLTAAGARESRLIAPREIKSKDGWFKARVPAKVVGVIEKVDDSYSIELDHGKGASIYCEVVPDGIDLADMVRVSAQSTMKRAEDLQGEIQARQIESLDAGVIGDVPYLSVSWVYTVKSAKGLLVGAFKQISMNKGGVGIYCAHVELGYTKTFAAVTRALAETIDIAQTRRTPYYQEVTTVSMGTTKSGVMLTTLERDSEGDTVATQKLSMLLPTNADNVASQDSVSIEWIDSDAELINALHIVGRDGELTTNLKLNPMDGEWIVAGELQGKAVSAKLDKGSHPGTWVAQAWALRRLLATPEAVGGEHSIPMWASADPGKLTDGKTKVVAKIDDTHYSALAKIGTLNAAVTLDATSGLPSAAEVQMGPQKLKLERVFVSGAF
ncbi:MAG: hypothetical protein WDO72_20250 [Pseudomonadota bacterium]